MPNTPLSSDVNEETKINSLPLGMFVGHPFEEILLRRGIISEEQLEQAQRQVEEKDEPLEDILLSMKAVSAEDLLKVRSEELDISYLEEIQAKEIDAELLGKVPLSFAKQSKILPISEDDDCVTIACSDPYNTQAFDQLQLLLNSELVPILYPESKLMDAINEAYDKIRGSFGFEDDEGLEEVGREKDEYDDLDEAVDLLDATDDEAPVIRLVNALIYRAIKERASDIHIEAFEKEVVVRFRIDGVLYQVTTAPKRAQGHIIARIKIMSGLNIAEKRLPQDGRIRLKIAGKDIDIRVSTIPTVHGERAVLRLLDKSNVLLDLTKIGFSSKMLVDFEELIYRSHGIILVTGPTGSGKTTTLYSALTKINSPDKNILTVEDPIEYQLEGIGQMQVNNKIGLSFASGLRAFLRQDPDVILVGETRDQETAEIAIQASLTGHLVFTTLHTNDSATAFTRLIDMGVQPFLVASSVVGILAQRLIRRVCQHCKIPYRPTDNDLEEIGLRREQLINDTIYQADPKGCEECLQVGYRGRNGIYELMMIDDQVRSMVINNEPSGKIKQYVCGNGMISLREDGATKIITGETTIEEISRVTQEEM